MADGGPTPGDGAIPPPDSGDPGGDAGVPAGELEAELWGARLYGRIRGLARFDRHLWITTQTTPEPLDESRIRAQVVRLHLDTGVVRVWEDELPRQTVGEGPFAVEGPVATAQAIEDGDRTLLVARSGILVLTEDAITEHALAVDGATATPIAAALDAERNALWVTSDRGLLRLAADTLAIERVLGADVLSTEQTGAVAVDATTGAIYVAAYFEGLDGTLGSSVLKIVDGALEAALTPGELDAPAGLVGDIVWSSNAAGVYVALASWDPAAGGVVRWDGATLEHVVDESILSRAAKGDETAFGATELALDETDQILIVGGQMRATGPITSPEGGGLAFVDLGALGTDRAVAGVSTFTSEVTGDHVMALAYDPETNRTYAALQQPCSETRLGNAGLIAVRFDDGDPAFEMPILSGIRDVAQRGDERWLAVRDDTPAVRCDGTNAQQGMVVLGANRAGMYADITGAGDYDDPAGFKSTRVGFNELDFSGAALLAAGHRNPIFAGEPTGGRMIHGPIELGVSLWLHDAAWEDERTFWVGGQATHTPGDPDSLADAGPRGAARVVLRADGRGIDTYTHYVHALRDPDPNAVEGLPSSEVYAILQDVERNTWLVSGTEQVRGAGYDRLEGEPFAHMGSVRTGGVTRIARDGTLTVIAMGDQVPDGRAAAFDAEGNLHVADAQRGLLVLAGEAFEEVELPLDIPEGSIPTAMWMGAGDDLAIAYSTGLLLRAGGHTEWLDGFGWAWSITAIDPGVLFVGTDEGLLRIRYADVGSPTELTLPTGSAPRFHVYEAPGTGGGGGGGGGGSCLPERTVCAGATEPCCPGLVCAGSGFVTECVPE